MRNDNTYPEKERFGRFCLSPKELFEKSGSDKEAFDERLKDLRNCNGAGWRKDEAAGYLVTGKVRCVMYTYGAENGRRYRRTV